VYAWVVSSWAVGSHHKPVDLTPNRQLNNLVVLHT
jgi:hypothetical protein